MHRSPKRKLSDGGPLYHPARPRIAHPGVRAAARFLLNIEKLAPTVVETFRQDVFPKFRWDEILERIELTEDSPRLTRPCVNVYRGILGLPDGAQRVAIDMVSMVEVRPPADTKTWSLNYRRFPQGPWQISCWGLTYDFQDLQQCQWVAATNPGIRWLKYEGWSVGDQRRPRRNETKKIQAVLNRLGLAADRYDADDRRRLAESCAGAISDWAKRFHLVSPHIYRLVLQVLHGWAYYQELPDETTKWGSRVEFLADSAQTTRLVEAVEARREANAPAQPDDELLEETSFPKGIVWDEPEVPPFVLRQPGWDVGFEDWETAKERFRAAFETSLDEYQRTTLERRREEGYVSAPYKYEESHFTWLVQRQIEGMRASKIAHKAHRAVTTVREALERTAALLDLQLRPVKPGRPSDL